MIAPLRQKLVGYLKLEISLKAELRQKRLLKKDILPFYVRDCRTLTQAQKLSPKLVNKSPDDLKYIFVMIACIHGGWPFKSRPKDGSRPLLECINRLECINQKIKSVCLAFCRSREFFERLPDSSYLSSNRKRSYCNHLCIKDFCQGNCIITRSPVQQTPHSLCSQGCKGTAWKCWESTIYWWKS